MADVREAILARVLAVLATIPTIKTAQRNNIDIPDELLPWAVVFDGDEETDDASDLSMRPSNRPTMVRMHPEILVVQQSDDAGAELSMLRGELIKRLLTDVPLNEQIVKTGRFGNGAIRYLGCVTDLHYGSSLLGGMRAQFMFKYTLNPNDL